MNDTTTLAQKMVAAPAAARNVSLSTDPKRIAYASSVALLKTNGFPDLLLPLTGASAGPAERGLDADKLGHKLKTSSMLEGLLCPDRKLSDFDCYLDFHKEHDVKLHSGIRDCVPLFINPDHVI